MRRDGETILPAESTKNSTFTSDPNRTPEKVFEPSLEEIGMAWVRTERSEHSESRTTKTETQKMVLTDADRAALPVEGTVAPARSGNPPYYISPEQRLATAFRGEGDSASAESSCPEPSGSDCDEEDQELTKSFDVKYMGKRYLTGKLFVRKKACKNNLKVNIHVRRPTEDAGFRDRWNDLGDSVPDSWDREAYADDENGNSWLWPHLYQLLTSAAPRYGGWDPFKMVDNDFAAVLIRRYDAAGKAVGAHMYSDKWHKVGGGANVSHTAGSEEFDLKLTCKDETFKVWFVFCDTFGDKLTPMSPDEGPKDKFGDQAGETIAYFEIKVDEVDGKLNVTVSSPALPAPATGYDW